MEPSPERLRAARLKVQGIIATFGVVPLWLSINLINSAQWGFAILWFAVFVAVEGAAFILVPVIVGANRRSREP